ncbi:protein giant [Wyeomyia smithii]|uniref:protein giant n=1 Tax=Wyeomyia smithii TaxID=174621 RepID=UPI002467E9B1|nr:protein giant [Wyeomyia smithii]
MMAQFMMDLKAEHRTSPSLYPPVSPKMQEIYRPNSTDSGVLDLSKRRDSVETRKTPSPYNSFSEEGSPPMQSSPINSTNQLLLNYRALQHRELSPKTQRPYDSPNLPEQSHQLAARFQGFPIGHPIIPKQESLPHRAEIMPYLLQAGAMQQQQQQQQQYLHSPIQQHRESDSLSESGSEGHILPPNLKMPLLKQTQSSDQLPTNQPTNNPYPMVIGRDGKLARPFKAYPRDPLSLTAAFMASDSILDTMSAEKYNVFRKRMLEQIRAANGGQATVCNPKMRRLNKSLSDASETESLSDKMPEPTNSSEAPSQQATPPSSTTDSNGNKHSVETTSNRNNNGVTVNGGAGQKDSAYYERRKKNNAAAKKSRDRRRIKEDEIAIRATFLENENMQLRYELAAARKQLALYGVTTVSP